ncbi:Gfo/Idh/MocA family oxidoreductase (plasmid) [Polymorphobacter sp. PAMC 29334]|uniref:Gfo/Idh/MocA family protein n=1 Tax=Polymorphobacter sp. PAMC 29334 TaxID=2862331 RepID=UPI001C67E0DE|nr:Gfo/Idh/MocA family oxidoreductase [Polymorphobacter sp. PAMC 29334]QYE33625.1 Gfo/Idh/MocA family oxidoreductase [Polymorphobacter sp. PAMC 29334]
MTPIRIAIVGMGKIARDQHLPAIAGNGDLIVTATVSPHHPGEPGIPHYKTLEALLADGPLIDAVALCTPPQVRYDLAATALAAGLHVFLEKPPGATLAEVTALERIAATSGVTLFASWHSRFAPGVEPAKSWLAGRELKSVSIVWREDVRVWHPGQAWIWEAGGLGVFDPGINALSIVTHILPHLIFLKSATLSLPANRAAPIAADLAFRDIAGTEITMDLDWRQTGPQNWDITVGTDCGICKLSSGGAVLTLPTGIQQLEEREYPALYERFATLVHEHRSEVDTAPLRLVADAFLSGTREIVEAFDD